MKPNNAPDWEQTKIDTVPMYLCADEILGCRGVFDKHSFRFLPDQGVYGRLSLICRRCEAKIAATYGLDALDAESVATGLKHMKWYEMKINGFSVIEPIERVRMLLLAAGVKILRPTEKEEAGAARIRKLVPEVCGVTVDLKAVPA
jgi:hypothetical protein